MHQAEVPFGILGLGRMGLIHCRLVAATDGLRLVAGSSRSSARRAEAERVLRHSPSGALGRLLSGFGPGPERRRTAAGAPRAGARHRASGGRREQVKPVGPFAAALKQSERQATAPGFALSGRALPGRAGHAIIRPVTGTVSFPRRAFQAALSPEERRLVRRLDDPEVIQDFLSSEIAYNFEPDGETAHGPVQVLRRRLAHCFEGAIFAAALLWYHGWEPLLVLLEAPQDFDHNLIVYSKDGLTGSVSQSRHPELRGKAAQFSGIRELVLSYYPDYTSDWTHDPDDLTLRGFSEPIDLRRFGSRWVTAAQVWEIYRTYMAGVRLECLFPSGEADRFYFYPEEHLAE